MTDTMGDVSHLGVLKQSLRVIKLHVYRIDCKFPNETQILPYVSRVKSVINTATCHRYICSSSLLHHKRVQIFRLNPRLHNTSFVEFGINVENFNLCFRSVGLLVHVSPSNSNAAAPSILHLLPKFLLIDQ